MFSFCKLGKQLENSKSDEQQDLAAIFRAVRRKKPQLCVISVARSLTFSVNSFSVKSSSDFSLLWLLDRDHFTTTACFMYHVGAGLYIYIYIYIYKYKCISQLVLVSGPWLFNEHQVVTYYNNQTFGNHNKLYIKLPNIWNYFFHSLYKLNSFQCVNLHEWFQRKSNRNQKLCL